MSNAVSTYVDVKSPCEMPHKNKMAKQAKHRTATTMTEVAIYTPFMFTHQNKSGVNRNPNPNSHLNKVIYHIVII